MCSIVQPTLHAVRILPSGTKNACLRRDGMMIRLADLGDANIEAANMRRLVALNK